MAPLAGYHHLSLTVTDASRSAAWYRDVLGFEVTDDFNRDGFRRVRLRQTGGITLTLTQHDDGSGDRFSELRTGLDHVAFAVESAADVEDLARVLDEHGVEHSGVKPTPAGPGAMVTVRDPDNIQLEVFAPGP